MKRTILLLTLVAAMVLGWAGAVLAQSTTLTTAPTKPGSSANNKQEATTPAAGSTTPATSQQQGPGPSVVSGQNGRIAFYSYRDGHGQIYVMNSDGSNQTNLSNNSYNDYDPAFSPDGKKIAFYSYRDGHYQIYVMNSDGSNQTNLSKNSYNDLYPAFSPDGTKIAFTSTRDGNEEIYVMNSDGTNLTRFSNNPASNVKPDWGVKVQGSVYGAYAYPGNYYSSCSCYLTPAKSQSVYAYGLEVPSKGGYYTFLDYYYSSDGSNYSFVMSKQAPNTDEGSYSLFLSQVQLPNSGWWKVVATDPFSGSQDSKIWYAY